MRKKYGYDSYRGRNAINTLLKVLALILVLVVVVGALLSVFLGQNLLVSTNGIRFDFGWHREEPPSPTPSTPVVLVTPSPSPTPTPQPQEPYLQALPLDSATLADGSAPQLVADWETNAVILDMKPDSGILGYVSQTASAKRLGTNASNETLNATIQAVLDTPDLYTIAHVSAFRDNTAPYQNNAVALRATYGNWRDEAGSRWLNPGNLGAQQYLLDLCAELAAMGFDEILLDNAAFPTQGSLDAIARGENYDPTTLTQQLSDFYEELDATLSDYPQVRLSFTAQVDALSNQDALSGQGLDGLLYGDRIWCSKIDTERSSLEKVLTDAGFEDATRNLVSIRISPGPQAESWAILPK